MGAEKKNEQSQPQGSSSTTRKLEMSANKAFNDKKVLREYMGSLALGLNFPKLHLDQVDQASSPPLTFTIVSFCWSTLWR